MACFGAFFIESLYAYEHKTTIYCDKELFEVLFTCKLVLWFFMFVSFPLLTCFSLSGFLLTKVLFLHK